jgi:hypothetical protein
MRPMAASYDDAVAELYQSAHDAFVTERKRLAGELKAAGDKAGAARLVKLARPTLSAWAVNQLWWHAREPFEQLLAAAGRLRAGDQGGASDRRDALASLKSRAASLLVEGGHAVSEGTLRRVATTLAALAANGGFEPDAAGALAADRDPPGFDAAGLGGLSAAGLGAFGAPSASVAAPAEPKASGAAALRERPAAARSGPSAEKPAEHARAPAADAAGATPDAAQARREEKAERERLERERLERERLEREREERELSERLRAEERRQEIERAARHSERQRLRASLPALRSDLERREREVERLRAEVARVEGLARQARAAIDEAEKRLTELGTDG